MNASGRACVPAAEKERCAMERGILVVSFGTTYQETREKNIDQMVALVREQYPHYLV